MEKLNQLITMVTNVGVIVGLAVLVYELNQNSDLMRVQISQSRADAAIASTESIYNSEYVPAILVKVSAGDPLTPEEAMRYDYWFRGMNRNQENVLRQYRAGMLGSISVRSFAKNVIASSALAQKTWDSQRLSYSSEYMALVDEVIQQVNAQ